MTKSSQVALALLGTVITVVVIQYARNGDRFVSAPAAAAVGGQSGRGGASTLARRVGPEAEVVTLEQGAAMPVSARPGVTAPATGTVEDEEAADVPTAERMTVFGIPVPKWVEEALGKRAPSVPGGMPVAATDPATSTTKNPSPSANVTGCKHELAPNPQGITAQLEFVGVLLNGGLQSGDSFSGAQLDDLNVLVQWKNLLQNHAQRVDLIAPDGSLYQSLPRLLTVDDVAAPVETRVPVNGSWITRYGLYGTWCVEIFVDQESAPVTSSRLVIAKPQ